MPYTATILTPSLITSHPTIIPSIARLHASCILIDGTLATFLPPLDPTILTTWWQARYAETLRSERIIIVIMTLAFGPLLPIPMTSDPTINALPTLIAGVVTLSTPFSETGPCRGHRRETPHLPLPPASRPRTSTNGQTRSRCTGA
jgi:hypothetical protein